MGERFSIDKFLDFTPAAWFKVFGLGLKIFVLAMVILGVVWLKNFFFPTAPKNVNQPNISVAEGGNLTYTVHQGKKERSWWVPTPFVEVYGFGETDSKDDRMGAGARGGLRWEF